MQELRDMTRAQYAEILGFGPDRSPRPPTPSVSSFFFSEEGRSFAAIIVNIACEALHLSVPVTVAANAPLRCYEVVSGIQTREYKKVFWNTAACGLLCLPHGRMACVAGDFFLANKPCEEKPKTEDIKLDRAPTIGANAVCEALQTSFLLTVKVNLFLRVWNVFATLYNHDGHNQSYDKIVWDIFSLTVLVGAGSYGRLACLAGEAATTFLPEGWFKKEPPPGRDIVGELLSRKRANPKDPVEALRFFTLTPKQAKNGKKLEENYLYIKKRLEEMQESIKDRPRSLAFRRGEQNLSLLEEAYHTLKQHVDPLAVEEEELPKRPSYSNLKEID